MMRPSSILLISLVIFKCFAFDECYKNTTTRGVGKPITDCPPNTEKDGALCYPLCQKGFNGVGPVCWEICPAGYVDTGAFCNPILISGDNKSCPWYDKCGLTFSKGCVKCGDGFEVSGCLCKTPGNVFAKKSYGRTAGKPLICAPGLEYDAGLCYPPCPNATYDGVGPVCWENCPAQSFTCGAICLRDKSQCTDEMKQISKTSLQLISKIVKCAVSEGLGCDIPGMIAQLKNLFKDLNIPPCSSSIILAVESFLTEVDYLSLSN